MFKRYFLLFIVTLFFSTCYLSCGTFIGLSSDQPTNKEITQLSECKTHRDSVYVIDNYSYNKNGNLIPPCSLSPDYCGCMKSRGITPSNCY